MPGSVLLQLRGLPLSYDFGQLVLAAHQPACPGPREPSPGLGCPSLPAALRLPVLLLALAAPQSALAVPYLPQGAPQTHLHLRPHHPVLWGLGDSLSGFLRIHQPLPDGLPPTDRDALLRAQHLAVCGGPLRLRPAVGHSQAGALWTLWRSSASRPTPPQVQVQLCTLLHTLGPSVWDPA